MRKRIEAGLVCLRPACAEVLAPLPVAERVEILDAIGRRLQEALAGDARCPLARPLQALLAREAVAEGTRAGIEAFAASLRRDAIWALLQEELGDPRVLDEFRPRASGGWHRATAPEVTACFFAGNTPLLAWPPLAAGLLAGSAVFGKLSRADTAWPLLFRDATAAVHPDLGRCIALEVWPGGSPEFDAALCDGADAVVAFGSDATIAALRARTPPGTPFHGYGHRLSIALILQGADEPEAAAGLARDVLLYDQQGCLSASLLFVEGDVDEATRFGEHLAQALDEQAGRWQLGPRDAEGCARVRVVRETALFAPDARVWGDPGCRWSVLLAPGMRPEPHGGECVVPIYPFTEMADLDRLLRPLRAALQGAAVAGPSSRMPAAAEILARAGVSRICAPGALQVPSFAWHHNGSSIVRHLLHWTDLETA